jgi:hypothetical protein
MSFSAVVYHVMLASPGDVTRERECAREVVHEWNVIHAAARRLVLLPTGWETHATPSIGIAPQETINREVLQTADLLVGVFWTRLGTQTSSHPSGTVEELERHIAAGKPALLYFSAQPAPLDGIDLADHERLKEFKEHMKKRGLFETYASSEEFREKFNRHLQLKLNDRGYFVGWTPEPRRASSSNVAPAVTEHMSSSHVLAPEAVRLLRAASGDKYGRITRRTDVAGVSIHSNKETFFNHGDARSLATWDAALAELQMRGFIEPTDYDGIFRVTQRGYQAVDRSIEISLGNG